MGRRVIIKPWVTVAWLARRYGKSEWFIKDRIQRGLIAAHPSRLNKHGNPSGWQISRDEVKRLDREGFNLREVAKGGQK